MLAEIETDLVALVNGSIIKPKLRETGTLPELDGEALVRKFASDAPAVYVAPAPFQIASRVMTVNFGMACVARNARGHEAARRGDGQVIGLYDMIEVLSGLVDGARTPSITWTATGVDFLSDEKLYQAGVYVGVIRLRGQIELVAPIDAAALAALADFKTFNADYDIDPHQPQAEHIKWAQQPPDYTASRPELTDTPQIQP